MEQASLLGLRKFFYAKLLAKENAIKSMYNVFVTLIGFNMLNFKGRSLRCWLQTLRSFRSSQNSTCSSFASPFSRGEERKEQSSLVLKLPQVSRLLDTSKEAHGVKHEQKRRQTLESFYPLELPRKRNTARLNCTNQGEAEQFAHVGQLFLHFRSTLRLLSLRVRARAASEPVSALLLCTQLSAYCDKENDRRGPRYCTFWLRDIVPRPVPPLYQSRW